MTTREEHLAWCKERALEYWREGDLVNAVISMGSDLTKHPETERSSESHLLLLGIMRADAHDTEGVRQWIEGFR